MQNYYIPSINIKTIYAYIINSISTCTIIMMFTSLPTIFLSHRVHSGERVELTISGNRFGHIKMNISQPVFAIIP